MGIRSVGKTGGTTGGEHYGCGGFSRDYAGPGYPKGITRDQTTAVEFLERVLLTKQNWVDAGRARPELNPGLSHNVSNTVNVRTDEWDSVRDFIWDNQKDLAGIALMGDDGEKKHSNAPREAVISKADEEKYNTLIRNYVPVDYAEMRECEDGTDQTGEVACSGGTCEQ